MANRRTVIVSSSLVVSTALTGCLNAVRGRFGEGSVSLSQRRREIIDIYQNGIDESNAGTEAWNTGITLFNEPEYVDAIRQFETAVEHFGEAENVFSEAEQECRAIDEVDAARLCADAIERSGLMAEAAMAGREASQAGADGEGQSTIAKHIRTAQEKEEEATAIEIREPDVIAATLSDE